MTVKNLCLARKVLLVLGLSALAAASCFGDVINLASSASETTNNSGSATINVTPDKLWGSAMAGSYWVSYTTSGDEFGSNFVSPPNGTDYIFSDTFTVSGTPTSGTVSVMADDTASVTLNGTLLMTYAPTAGNPYIVCSGLPIGCAAGTTAVINLTNYLQSGVNVLDIQVLQTHGVAYGLDYLGSVDYTPSATATPEPATFVLLGAPLVAFSLLRRKRKD